MNNIFNAKRFGHLFIKHTAEHFKTYLMSLAVLVGVLVLGASFLALIPGAIDRGMQSVMFVFVLLAAGTLFTSNIFADLGEPKRAIDTLMLPASHFEKFLVAWVYSFVIYCVVFTGLFYLILFGLLNFKHIPNQHTDVFNIFSEPAAPLFLIFAFLHSISFYGAVFFNKLHFIKTAFCFFVILAFVIFFNTVFIQALIGQQIRAAIPFGRIEVLAINNYVGVGSDDKSVSAVNYYIIVISCLFWAATYFRLKEKQV
jgi:hypothetical protein